MMLQLGLVLIRIIIFISLTTDYLKISNATFINRKFVFPNVTTKIIKVILSPVIVHSE